MFKLRHEFIGDPAVDRAADDLIDLFGDHALEASYRRIERAFDKGNYQKAVFWTDVRDRLEALIVAALRPRSSLPLSLR